MDHGHRARRRDRPHRPAGRPRHDLALQSGDGLRHRRVQHHGRHDSAVVDRERGARGGALPTDVRQSGVGLGAQDGSPGDRPRLRDGRPHAAAPRGTGIDRPASVRRPYGRRARRHPGVAARQLEPHARGSAHPAFLRPARAAGDPDPRAGSLTAPAGPTVDGRGRHSQLHLAHRDPRGPGAVRTVDRQPRTGPRCWPWCCGPPRARPSWSRSGCSTTATRTRRDRRGHHMGARRPWQERGCGDVRGTGVLACRHAGDHRLARARALAADGRGRRGSCPASRSRSCSAVLYAGCSPPTGAAPKAVSGRSQT